MRPERNGSVSHPYERYFLALVSRPPNIHLQRIGVSRVSAGALPP